MKHKKKGKVSNAPIVSKQQRGYSGKQKLLLPGQTAYWARQFGEKLEGKKTKQQEKKNKAEAETKIYFQSSDLTVKVQ